MSLPPVGPRFPGQNCLNGGNAHLDHAVVRLIGGEVLQQHTRGSQNSGKAIVMAACPAVDFISNAHNQRQKQQLKGDHQQPVAEAAPQSVQPRKQGQQQRGRNGENQNGNDHNHQQEAGSAAGVETGHFPDVLHGQRQPRLVAADGLVLRSVVGEHPAHFLHSGNQKHIPQENHHTNQAFQQIQNQNAGNGLVKETVKYKGRYITVVITSSIGRKLYLHPRLFAELMTNPNNLLLNYGYDRRIHRISFEETFKDNEDVNLIFDTNVITPSEFAYLANRYMHSKKTCFVIENINYSLSDQIKGFGLSEKKNDADVYTDISADDLFDF